MFRFKLTLSVFLFALFAVATPGIQAFSAPPTWMTPYEQAKQGLPDTIAGLRVLAVLTPGNTACLPPGEKRLVLQAAQPDIESYLGTSNYAAITADLNQKSIDEYVQWNVEIVGPGTTLDQFLGENERWNGQRQKSGCAQAMRALTGSDYQEYKAGPGTNGYAMYEDTDAGLYTNDNAQSVYLIAPASIANTPKAVLFLNNVKTDNSSFYLFQNGLQFQNGTGTLIWTDTTKGYVNQTYNIPYIASHTYWFTISYSNGLWYMCGKDNGTPSTYTCLSESQAVGTTLGLDINTNVFVENQNTTANWYVGFSSPLRAWGAQIYRNGTGQWWGTQHHHTEDHCTTNYPPANALTGTMLGGNTGNFLILLEFVVSA
jgi:hypothetical protein